MQLLRVRRLMLGGALAIAVALGGSGALTMDRIGTAFAQESDGEIDLDGVVEAMPPTGLVGAWLVSGRAVVVTDETVIDQELGALAIGVAVEVQGAELPDGSIRARELEVLDQHGE